MKNYVGKSFNERINLMASAMHINAANKVSSGQPVALCQYEKKKKHIM